MMRMMRRMRAQMRLLGDELGKRALLRRLWGKGEMMMTRMMMMRIMRMMRMWKRWRKRRGW